MPDVDKLLAACALVAEVLELEFEVSECDGDVTFDFTNPRNEKGDAFTILVPRSTGDAVPDGLFFGQTGDDEDVLELWELAVIEEVLVAYPERAHLECLEEVRSRLVA